MVDDCSQDGTQTLLREKISAVVDRVTCDPVNRGKGAALRSRLSSAFAAARVRQSGRPPWFPIHGRTTPSRLFSGTWSVTNFWTLLSNIFTNLNLTDVETGYKPSKASLIKSLNLKKIGLGSSRNHCQAHAERLSRL
jgi:hypothetical protein